MQILREGHEAYGLAEKKLGDKYKFEVRAMPYTQKFEGLEQRKSYFEDWQNEVADRLPGKKTTSMGKFGTPATRFFGGEGSNRNLEGSLNEYQFMSMTTLRTEGMFSAYNRDQVVPSVLEFKYLSSRSALECAMKSAMELGFTENQEKNTLRTQRRLSNSVNVHKAER